MDQRNSFSQWIGGDPDKWAITRHSAYFNYVVFEMTQAPNFSEPRFRALGESLDERRAELARRQIQTLRQLHSFGEYCAFALRIRKVGAQLRLFLIARQVSGQPLSSPQLDQFAGALQQALPKEYSLTRLTPEKDSDRWAAAMDLAWANYADEIIKPETTFPANTWPFFYVASLWSPQSMNDMEGVCRAMLRQSGDAMISVELTPTLLQEGEREWVDRSTRMMREATNGERLYSEDNRTLLKSYQPMPALRTPTENYENLLKQYSSERVFLHSFRVFTSESPFALTQALATSATRSVGQILSVSRQQSQFRSLIEDAALLNVTPDIRSPWWNAPEQRPLRAQRLHRLADLNEVSGFWRLPIPMQAGFPGFDLDVGRRSDTERRQVKHQAIHLGIFADDSSHREEITAFDREGLTKHALVVGVPGSGKTTTMFSILHQLWNHSEPAERIPFMVLEPAKTEYRALKGIHPFQNDMLVFSLGDERISPFRFNPFEVPRGIPVESHIARLNACFVGAFNLFDPLPLLLDKAIRQAYAQQGWLDDSVGGEPGLVAPTMTDLVLQAEDVVRNSGFSERLAGDFNTSLLQRLDSLRRGSKGRMLDTRDSIPFDLLMQRPVIFELDALNGDEKALLMMFLLTFVYEYAKANRRSGSPLRHVLLVEEAHNLIGRYSQGSSEHRANPKQQSIELFVRMLAEMRALGQGILIADQLPTAIAPEALKQTNLKILMRMTARDDREEIGNTMDLEEAHLKGVTRFKSGQAYVYLEEWDRVRQVQMINFKSEQQVEEPPDDPQLTAMMADFELAQAAIYMPFPECPQGCRQCNRRVRNLAERFIAGRTDPQAGVRYIGFTEDPNESFCQSALAKIELESALPNNSSFAPVLRFCMAVHVYNYTAESRDFCHRYQDECLCKAHAQATLIRETVAPLIQ